MQELIVKLCSWPWGLISTLELALMSANNPAKDSLTDERPPIDVLLLFPEKSFFKDVIVHFNYTVKNRERELGYPHVPNSLFTVEPFYL